MITDGLLYGVAIKSQWDPRVNRDNPHDLCESGCVDVQLICVQSLLEAKLGAKLHVARRHIAARRTEACARVSNVGVYAVEIHPVEQVEDVQAKLDVEALSDGSAFLYGQIGIRIAGIAEQPKLLVSFRSRCLECRLRELGVGDNA